MSDEIRPYPIATNESQRLQALHRYSVLDTPSEAAFDRLTALAASLLNVPVAQVTLIDDDRQWFKASYGLPRGETPRVLSFCSHAILESEVFEVGDATSDARFKKNALVTGEPFIRAYVGAPITTRDGFKLGTVCAIDTKPRIFTAEQRDALQHLAAMAADELELRRVGMELRDSLARLRKTEAQRDDLAHMIIHDLRSPLSCVKGYVDVLALTATAKLDDDERKCVMEAQAGATRLNQLITTLLDVSRLEGGEMPLTVGPHDLCAIARDAGAQFASMLEKRSLTYDFPPSGVICQCDRDLIRRVLENLLANAVKFTKSDGTITLRVQYDAANVEISVRDDGEGIPALEQDRIFEKFGQTSNGANHRHSSGLGLTFCKLAIERHGGMIAVKSQVGKGTIFLFRLPTGAKLPRTPYRLNVTEKPPEPTGLEPATSAVTGRRSNQLS
jgi:two-component system, sensor histidine kinase